MIESLKYDTAAGDQITVSPISRPYLLSDTRGVSNLRFCFDPEDGSPVIEQSLPCTISDPPPAGDFTITPTGQQNEYEFNLTSNDPTESLTITNLDYGDGSPVIANADTITTHTYPSSPSDQNYTVSYTADDGVNPPVLVTLTWTVPASNIAPVCGYTAQVTQTLIEATSTATDPDGGPQALSISWRLLDEFDNLIASDSGSTFTFNTNILVDAAGTFTLIQTVDDGTDTDECIDTVVTSEASGFTFTCTCVNN